MQDQDQVTDMGYEKTAQCKTKIKNLTAKYRKVKDSNRKSGNSLDSSFAYFMELMLSTAQGLHWNRISFCTCEPDSD